MSNDAIATTWPTRPSVVAQPQMLPHPQTQAGAQDALQLSWSPPPGMVALSFKNFALRIVTLGIYNFWGKTEVRKRIWAAIRINGEPLQYTGTGKEMLLGFLMVLALFTVPSLLISFVVAIFFGNSVVANVVLNAAMAIAAFYLIGVGAHRAVRYRMSRTLWRGIRGGLEGNAWGYGWTYFWTGPLLFLIAIGGVLLVAVVALGLGTQGSNARVLQAQVMLAAGPVLLSGIVVLALLAWILPWRQTKLQRVITSGLRFGNQPFHFTAKARPLYKHFALLWLGTIAIVVLVFVVWGAANGSILSTMRPGRTLGAGSLFMYLIMFYGAIILGYLLFGGISAWYRAKVMNHYAAHTTFAGARLVGTANGRSLFWLTITNMLMVLFTLGLLAPVAQARAARYFVEHLRLEGGASLAEIMQRADDGTGRGEGLAQAFDIDAF